MFQSLKLVFDRFHCILMFHYPLTIEEAVD